MLRRLFPASALSHSRPASVRHLASLMEGRPMYNRMMKKFTEEFQPAVLEVIDESTSHAEHEAMRQHGYNETHFRVLIVSDRFAGKLPVARHRMVYSLLDGEFKEGLHAVNIIAKTPAEYERQQPSASSA